MTASTTALYVRASNATEQETLMRTGSFTHVESFLDGEIVVREGDVSRAMFVIQRGRVEVTKLVGESEILLATLERGSFFGEMSLLDSQPRTATVRARGETRLLVIEPGSLLMKIRRDPTFAFEMLQHLSARIRDLDERLVQLMTEHQRTAKDPFPAVQAAWREYASRESTQAAEPGR